MAERPDVSKLPTLKSGGWGYDEKRKKITLRYSLNGKAEIERGETAQECLTKRNRRERDRAMRADLTGDGTLGGMLAEWLEFISISKANRTLDGYRQSIDNFTAQLGADTDPLTLTVATIETMWARMIGRGLSRATMHKRKGHWSAALAFAQRRALIPMEIYILLSTAEMPDIPKKQSREQVRWFDLADYGRVRTWLIDHPSARNTLFLTMLLCGLRPGEALGLKWYYVDLGRLVLRVEGQIGDGDEYTTVLKTDHMEDHDHAHRDVPIHEDLAVALDKLPRVNEFLFIEDTGRAAGRRITHGPLDDHAKEICLITGARAHEDKTKHVNPNGFRHTFASVCRHNHMPYEILAKLMGHKNTKQIIETYGHPLTDSVSVDINRYLNDGGAT